MSAAQCSTGTYFTSSDVSGCSCSGNCYPGGSVKNPSTGCTVRCGERDPSHADTVNPSGKHDM